MADLRFELKVAAVEKALAEYAGTEKVRKALGALGRVIQNRILLGFKTGTSPYGVPWKKPVLRSGQPLIDTGRLRGSISSRVEGETVRIGTNLFYAPVHQFGAVILPVKAKRLRVPFGGSAGGQSPKGFLFLKRAVIPPRPFMPINPAGQAELPAAWANSALNAMARAFDL